MQMLKSSHYLSISIRSDSAPQAQQLTGMAAVAEAAVLAACAGEAPELAVLVHGVDDPVHAGIVADGRVHGVDQDDLKVLVAGVLHQQRPGQQWRWAMLGCRWGSQAVLYGRLAGFVWLQPCECHRRGGVGRWG